MRARNLNGALFSLLWPGLGQLLQGRILQGTFFAVWSGVSAIGFLHAASAQQFALPIAMEFTLVAAWSIVAAYSHLEAERPHAASSPARQIQNGVHFKDTRRFLMTAQSLPILSDPDIMGGTPVFAGTRVPVQTFVEYLEAGDPLDEFLTDFPSVTREQAVAVLELAKDLLLARAVA